MYNAFRRLYGGVEGPRRDLNPEPPDAIQALYPVELRGPSPSCGDRPRFPQDARSDRVPVTLIHNRLFSCRMPRYRLCPRHAAGVNFCRGKVPVVPQFQRGSHVDRLPVSGGAKPTAAGKKPDSDSVETTSSSALRGVAQHYRPATPQSQLGADGFLRTYNVPLADAGQRRTPPATLPAKAQAERQVRKRLDRMPRKRLTSRQTQVHSSSFRSQDSRRED